MAVIWRLTDREAPGRATPYVYKCPSAQKPPPWPASCPPLSLNTGTPQWPACEICQIGCSAWLRPNGHWCAAPRAGASSAGREIWQPYGCARPTRMSARRTPLGGCRAPLAGLDDADCVRLVRGGVVVVRRCRVAVDGARGISVADESHRGITEYLRLFEIYCLR